MNVVADGKQVSYLNARLRIGIAMELSWLEDFLVLASTGNFSISAAQRNITQSAFSKRIKALETWLGTELVDRRTFPALLTPAGQTFREVAQNTVNMIYAERGRLQGTFVQNKAELRILGATTLLLQFAPNWIIGLQKICGNFSASLKTQNFYTMVQALNDREADFVLQYAHPNFPSLYDKSNICSVLLATEKFLPVSAKQGAKPVFDLDYRPPHEIPWLRYSKDGFLSRIEGKILERNPSLDTFTSKGLESPTAEVLKRFALQGFGVAWLPFSAVEQEFSDGLLCSAGGKKWQDNLEIRAYALKESMSHLAAQIWKHLETGL